MVQLGRLHFLTGNRAVSSGVNRFRCLRASFGRVVTLTDAGISTVLANFRDNYGCCAVMLVITQPRRKQSEIQPGARSSTCLLGRCIALCWGGPPSLGSASIRLAILLPQQTCHAEQHGL